MVSKKSPFDGGTAQLQKELQGYVGFIAYQDINSLGDSMTKDQQRDKIGDDFFGDPTKADKFGLAEQLVQGRGIFSGLYMAVDCSTEICCTGGGDDHADDDGSLSSLGGTSTSTGSTGTPGTIYVLKPYLHCLGINTRIVRGSSTGINVKLLHRKGLNDFTPKSREPMNYRTLFSRVEEILRNCKKALSIVMAPNSPYKDYIGTGYLPSGMGFEDYLFFVRKRYGQDASSGCRGGARQRCSVPHASK